MRLILMIAAVLSLAGAPALATSPTQGGVDAALARILEVESNGRYGVTADNNGAIGGYQFRRQALETIGYVQVKAGCPVGDWSCVTWTDRATAQGVDSLSTFLASKDTQDAAARALYDVNRKELARSEVLSGMVGQTINGRTLTEEDILAAMWKEGPSGTTQYLLAQGNPQGDAAIERARRIEGYLDRYARASGAGTGVEGIVGGDGSLDVYSDILGTAAGGDCLRKCRLCRVFVELKTFAFGSTGSADRGFARETYESLAVYAANVARVLAVYSILWLMVKVIWLPEAARETWRSTTVQAGYLILAGFLLSSQGAAWIFDSLFLMLQRTALGIGTFIMARAAPASCPVAVGEDYAAIWAVVEMLGFQPISIAMTRYAALGWQDLLSAIPWAILSVPYIFVCGVFGAFLVQAMFYFLAVSSVSPVLLIFLVWPSLRGFATGGMKIMVSGALTIIMASVAMGFTGSVQARYNQMLAIYQQHGGNLHNIAMTYQNRNIQLLEPICSASSIVCSAEYWMSFLIGFMSILLHLLAPRLAANISGASDSAATAAGVVAAGQFAGAKALGYGKAGLSRGADAAAGAAKLGANVASGGWRGAGNYLADQFSSKMGLGGGMNDMRTTRAMMESMGQMSLGVQNLGTGLTEMNKAATARDTAMLDTLRQLVENTRKD